MSKLLPPADIDDDEIAKMPEVYDPDPFDIVPAPTVSAVPDFPVRIAGAAGSNARVVDAAMKDVATANPAPDPWPVRLQRGFFKVVVADGREKLFEVSGGELDVSI
jgi:hypothetical protein